MFGWTGNAWIPVDEYRIDKTLVEISFSLPPSPTLQEHLTVSLLGMSLSNSRIPVPINWGCSSNILKFGKKMNSLLSLQVLIYRQKRRILYFLQCGGVACFCWLKICLDFVKMKAIIRLFRILYKYFVFWRAVSFLLRSYVCRASTINRQ